MGTVVSVVQEVCRLDAQVQALIVEPTCPVLTEGSKDDDSRAAALAALMAEKQTLQLKLEEADRRLAEAKARADKACTLCVCFPYGISIRTVLSLATFSPVF